MTAPRMGGKYSTSTPHVRAPRTAIAADRDQQRRGPPAQRFVREASGQAGAGGALAAATPAPLIGRQDPAGQHRATGLQTRPGDLQPELVQSAERGQVSACERSGPATSRSFRSAA